MQTLAKTMMAGGLMIAFAAVPFGQADAHAAASSAARQSDNQTVAGKANDGWITTKVKSEFAANHTVDASDIDVDTHAGAVTLRGNVSSQMEKNTAESLARSVKGVTSVDASGLSVAGSSAMGQAGNGMDDNHRGMGGAAKDAWITAKVKSQFAADHTVDASDINVDTNGGRVTLNGNVSSSAERDAAVRLARSVKGVTSVDTSGLMITADH